MNKQKNNFFMTYLATVALAIVLRSTYNPQLDLLSFVVICISSFFVVTLIEAFRIINRTKENTPDSTGNEKGR